MGKNQEPHYDIYYTLDDNPRYWSLPNPTRGYQAAMSAVDTLGFVTNLCAVYFALQGIKSVSLRSHALLHRDTTCDQPHVLKLLNLPTLLPHPLFYRFPLSSLSLLSPLLICPLPPSPLLICPLPPFPLLPAHSPFLSPLPCSLSYLPFLPLGPLLPSPPLYRLPPFSCLSTSTLSPLSPSPSSPSPTRSPSPHASLFPLFSPLPVP
ncbi:unnamed protein product [Closterium sp. NIES-64]|nr:unnamed protein product [Closterium sp. NIES-64]